MAKATRKKAATTKVRGKLTNKQVDKLTTKRKSAKLAKPASTDTREGLIAEMGALLDRVDAALPGLDTVVWHATWGALSKYRAEEDALEERMWELLDRDQDVTPSDVFGPALEAPGGAVPTLARAGAWVEWVGYIPVVVYWCGFLGHDSSFTIADPAERWINTTGYQTAYLRVDHGKAELRKMARNELTSIIKQKGFTLHDVSGHAIDAATARLAESEWLRKLLAAGPVDALPLPASLKALQIPLFV
jgi:hypothetical protein